MSPISNGSDCAIDPVSADPSPQTIHWRGIGTLAEECGEVLQMIGKAVAFPSGNHPDGHGPVQSRFVEELGDLQAAIDYFCQTNGLPDDQIQVRRQRKLQQFNQWGLTGIRPHSETD